MQRAIEETNRRREKQVEYNTAQRHHAGEHQALDPRHHGQRLRARPRADLDRRRGSAATSSEAATIGHNFEAVLADLEDAHARGRRRSRLRGGRAAARRDQAPAATELAVVDNPTAKIFLHPPPCGEGRPPKAGRGGGRSDPEQAEGPHKPHLDEMGIATCHEVEPHRPGERRPRKPTLDEMGPGVESVPAKRGASLEARPPGHARWVQKKGR